jgi:hypothetical protein
MWCGTGSLPFAAGSPVDGGLICNKRDHSAPFCLGILPNKECTLILFSGEKPSDHCGERSKQFSVVYIEGLVNVQNGGRESLAVEVFDLGPRSAL